MRPKRSSLDLEFQRLARHFNIVVQQFEPWILPHTQPYDSSSPKVREGANPVERHRERSVPSGDRLEHRPKLFGTLVRLVAEEFQREVQRLGRELARREIAERALRIGRDGMRRFVELDRDESADQMFWT